MNTKTSLNLWMALACWLITINPAFAALMPCEATLMASAIPSTAYFLPESQALQLQAALYKYSVVRLKPLGDYSSAPTINLTSNQALYGLAGTKLPAIILPAGTSNAILSGVSPQKITFQGGTGISQQNCINRIINSKLEVDNASLQNNLFTDLSNIQINIDTSQQGYIKGNRFIRTMTHSAYPAITINGDSAKQSTNNQFMWTNILTPWGDGIIVKNQQNISFIGIDAESWNWNNLAVYPGMMNVLNTDFLSVFMSNGGDGLHNTGQYFNIDASTVLLQGMQIGRTQNPGIILGKNVKNLFTINTQDIGIQQGSAGTQTLNIFNDNKPLLDENQNPKPSTNITAASKQALLNTLQADQNAVGQWNQLQFQFPNIPDPAGANWNVNLSTKPDSSSLIQKLINQNGIAQLNAGIYYISKPLQLKDGQGIIGAGADKTAIIAMNSGIDMIVGANHADNGITITSFTLADITLQGGFNGINNSNLGSGQGAYYNLFTLSHVTFRNMQNAGILISNIFGWDNNFIDHTNFYKCKTGIKQRPNPFYLGGNAMGMTFLDKNVFYQNQFIENDLAIDWQAKRANNLNAFIDCLFQNNLQVINQNNSLSTFFANDVFETASNQPILASNTVTGFVNSLFVSNQPANSLFDGNVLCNNCTFDNRLSNSGLIVSANSTNSYFVSNKLLKLANQPINTGLIVNSNFSGNPQNAIINQIINNQVIQPF